MRVAELRFLVVEDHGFQRWVTGNLLEGMGARHVYSAGDGRVALETLAGVDPPIDVVISDLDMPGMDGMELIRHLGEAEAPVSLIVASSLDRSLVATVEVMAKAYGVHLLGALEKPVTVKKLDALLAKYSPPAERASIPADDVPAAEIAEAVRSGQFEPYFQPKIEVATRRFKGAEANARWLHPTRGLLSPDAFIPTLESAGLIDHLTETILGAAAENCARWREAGALASVSVNLSLTMLSDTALADRMRWIVEARGLEPQHVIFEVTESAAAGNLGKALENLSRLRMKGFGLSIDDYGTGYSSMERLARVPFTELKIDKAFVQNAHSDPASRAMLESSLEMAQKLRIAAVAEGVESQAQWDLLRTLRCPLAQGYYIARPMEAEVFLEWTRVSRQMMA